MYIGYFFIALTISFLCTAGVRMLMQRYGIVDRPKKKRRKIHKKNIPLGGGVAIFLGFFVVVFLAYLNGWFRVGNVEGRHILGIFFGSVVLIVGGLIDDKCGLKARYQIWFPVLAALIVIAFGIGPHVVTNPFGQALGLDRWIVSFGSFGNWIVLADTVVFFWLMSMMFTTKFLDGLDGLVTGMVVIGAFIIFFLSLQEAWYQADVALLAIIFAGASVGFLVWNWHPAKIFLGEGGSLFTGFILGSLAIISGGKIATTLLVMGIPMLDVLRVIIRRFQKGKPIYMGDSEHLHFKLLSSGFSHKQAVLLFYAISFLFGITTLFLQSRQKLIALIFLFILMLLLGIWFSRKEHRV